MPAWLRQVRPGPAVPATKSCGRQHSGSPRFGGLTDLILARKGAVVPGSSSVGTHQGQSLAHPWRKWLLTVASSEFGACSRGWRAGMAT